MAGKLRIQQYSIDLRKQIGRGEFGAVYSTKNCESGINVAAKQISQVHSKEDLPNNVQGELIAMNRGLKHKNIIEVFEHHFKEGSYWIFMELCDIDLDKYTQKHCSQMNYYTKLDIMRQSASGLAFLHQNNIVHRDLKPRNILLRTQDQLSPVVKITDFGTAKLLQEGQSELHTFAGTKEFMAPELLQPDPDGKLSYRKTVDTFSLGLVFLALEQATPGQPLNPTLEDPTKSAKEANAACIGLSMALRKESGGDYLRLAAILESDSLLKQHVKNLINHMTNTEPRHRPPMETVENKLLNLLNVRNACICCTVHHSIKMCNIF